MGPCHSIGPQTVQIVFAKVSVLPPRLSLNHSCDRLAQLKLDSPWASSGSFLMCLPDVSLIFESFPSFLEKTTLSCDIQWLFLNCGEHKFLVSQGFQYSYKDHEYLSHMATGSCSSVSHFVLSTLQHFSPSTLFQAFRYPDSNCVTEVMPYDSLPYF